MTTVSCVPHNFGLWHRFVNYFKKPENKPNFTSVEVQTSVNPKLEIVGSRKLVHRDLVEKLRTTRFWYGLLNRRAYLKRDYYFKNREMALQFIDSVNALSKKTKHFPKIIFQNLHVLIILRTNEVDGLTEKDIQMANAIDSITSK
jgi:4a-hydroxytetrahydrobiopterin dehydratase